MRSNEGSEVLLHRSQEQAENTVTELNSGSSVVLLRTEGMADMGNTTSTSVHNSYVPLYPYNGTTATGGDSLSDNLNLFYEVSVSPVTTP